MVRIVVSVLFLVVLSCAGGSDRSPWTSPEESRSPAFSKDAKRLSGTAEDLWGGRVNLETLGKGPVLLHPFSTSNCGYCLIDGPFVLRNYLSRNERQGGRSFHQCLFNPQRDIHTFLKHERDSTPVLTFPPELHRYHKNGFPWMMAFRDGRLLRSGTLWPYEQTFDTLAGRLWPDDHSPLLLTSPLHMASRFVFENTDSLGVVVIPDGDAEARASWVDRLRSRKSAAALVVFEHELSGDLLTKNLCFAGPLERFRFDALEGAAVAFDSTSLRIGPHRFAKRDVNLDVCFPNPHRPDRYVVMQNGGSNAVDYTVCRRASALKDSEVLLQGYFRKEEGNLWSYDESLAFGDRPAAHRVALCPAPVAMETVSLEVAPSPGVSGWTHSAAGRIRSFGGTGARFPSLAADGDAGCWLAWEERGDVFAARVEADHPAVLPVETGPSDSFDPVVLAREGGPVVLYLNDEDGVYRLRLREMNAVGSRSTGRPGFGPVLVLSGSGPFDAVTPAAVCDRSGDLVLAWSEWRANQRFLMTRRIASPGADQGAAGPIVRAAVLENEDGYTNAWWPAVAADTHGVWAAWNQHYPSTLGVCAGSLEAGGFSVTRLEEKSAEGGATEERGGYPSVAVDRDGIRWVFWEGSGWDVLAGKNQEIRFASFLPGLEERAAQGNLSEGLGTAFNQTPRAAVDAAGNLCVVWSGRERSGSAPWSVYLTRREADGWTLPERVSPAGENARAPAIAASGSDGAHRGNRAGHGVTAPGAGPIWIAWHAGTGEAMTVRVLRLELSGRESMRP